MRSLLVACWLFISAHAATISRNARCGSSFGTTCLNSQWGSCCSQHGWCGSTTDYCGIGCQSKFGTCVNGPSSLSLSSSSRTSPMSTRSQTSSTRSQTSSTRVPAPSASQTISKNARCGASFGEQTCLGSQWGNCCSQYNYCGNTIQYCGPQSCQAKYGKCDMISSSSARSSTGVSQTTALSMIRTLSSSASTTVSTSASQTRMSSSTSQTSTPFSSSSTSTFIATTSPTATSTTSSSISTTASASGSASPTSSPGTTSSITPTIDTPTPTPAITPSSVFISIAPTASSTPASSPSLPLPTACNPGGLQPRFLLLVTNSGTSFDGQYGIQDDNLAAEVMTFGPVTSASVFTFNDDCNLIAGSGNIANLPAVLTDSPVYFDSLRAISDNGFIPIRCDISNNALGCAIGTANTFFVCDSDPFLQIAERSPSSCGTPILRPFFR